MEAPLPALHFILLRDGGFSPAQRPNGTNELAASSAAIQQTPAPPTPSSRSQPCPELLPLRCALQSFAAYHLMQTPTSQRLTLPHGANLAGRAAVIHCRLPPPTASWQTCPLHSGPRPRRKTRRPSRSTAPAFPGPSCPAKPLVRRVPCSMWPDCVQRSVLQSTHRHRKLSIPNVSPLLAYFCAINCF